MMQKFPLNLAAVLDPDLQKKIFRYMQDSYIWPQIMERASFEPLWDKLLKLARINLEDIDLNWDVDSRGGKAQALSGRKAAKVSDSVIFDAIDRLSNMNHFISFKDGFPAQFIRPDYIDSPYETDVYSPLDKKVKAGNALLRWNGAQEDVYRKHLIACRHHYTYGCTFIRSEFEFKTELVTRQNNFGQPIQRREITKIGATFDPISIRRLWLNFRLPAWAIDSQPCPFYMEETPYFAMLQKQYDPDQAPFGYANLDKLQPGAMEYLYSSQETSSLSKAIGDRIPIVARELGMDTFALPNLLRPEHSVNARFVYYPMLPLDPETGDWIKRKDGSLVPFSRYIAETYGSNMVGNQQLLRLQLSFYPRSSLPIYGSAHMPDMDSGMYTPSIGELLFNHYKEIVTCTNQFIENKEWINNPPAWVQTASPSQDEDLNRPGAKIKVNGPNDFGWKQPYDATASTANMRQMLRDEAQTTSKAVDAILGKAMGGRTSATEASNAYQASMSGITTDINLFNYDISGGFANRVWRYAAAWLDPDLLFAITGQFGFAMKPEEMWLELGLKCNVGSTYIEGIVRQQNLRYLGEAGRGIPNIRMDRVFRDLCEEMKFGNPKQYVEDGGWEKEVVKATLQAQKTYLGQPVFLSPDQNHDLAIKVKTAFIEDEDSVWNKEHPEFIPLLIGQIQMHQQFLMMQMQLQQQFATLQNAQGMVGGGGGQPQTGGAPPMQMPGQMAQLQGGTV